MVEFHPVRLIIFCMKLKPDYSCFQASYQSARQRLLGNVSHIPGQLVQDHRVFEHPLQGPDSKPLFLDMVMLGQTPEPAYVLVLISATHGVEGFAGSAIQSDALSVLTQALQKYEQLGIIVLHALNPWGFAWLRRYDQEGIDLNRNFIDFRQVLPENMQYHLIHTDLFVEPAKPLDDVLAFWYSKLGKQELETIITRGQYQHNDGIFYGGNSPSWSRQTLESACNITYLQNASKIAVIDLHTGLGPYGFGEVINDHEVDSTGFRWACDWYGDYARSALLGESCSAPKTGLLDYFWHELIGERGCFVTLEFGTYELDKLLLVSCEEQRYHNSYGKDWQLRDISHESVTLLRNFFYPQDQVWRELILIRAREIINLAIQGILK